MSVTGKAPAGSGCPAANHGVAGINRFVRPHQPRNARPGHSHCLDRLAEHIADLPAHGLPFRQGVTNFHAEPQQARPFGTDGHLLDRWRESVDRERPDRRQSFSNSARDLANPIHMNANVRFFERAVAAGFSQHRDDASARGRVHDRN